MGGGHGRSLILAHDAASARATEIAEGGGMKTVPDTFSSSRVQSPRAITMGRLVPPSLQALPRIHSNSPAGKTMERASTTIALATTAHRAAVF